MTTLDLAKEFVKYCEKYPEQRFMQALRNFLNVPFLGFKNNLEGEFIDTFYIRNENIEIDN